MDVIADYLFYTNAKEFFKHSRQLTLNDNLTRIIGDFASSECHRMVDELLKDKKRAQCKWYMYRYNNGRYKYQYNSESE